MSIYVNFFFCSFAIASFVVLKNPALINSTFRDKLSLSNRFHRLYSSMSIKTKNWKIPFYHLPLRVWLNWFLFYFDCFFFKFFRFQIFISFCTFFLGVHHIHTYIYIYTKHIIENGVSETGVYLMNRNKNAKHFWSGFGMNANLIYIVYGHQMISCCKLHRN